MTGQRFSVSAFIAIFVLSAGVPAAAQDRSNGLVGAWSASRSFGPTDLPAKLDLRTSRAGWSATLGRLQARSAARNGIAELSFADGMKLRVASHPSVPYVALIQPATTIRNTRYAIAVRVKSAGLNRWSGTVTPIPDQVRFTIFIDTAPDGTLRATFRNPEYNIGARLGPRTVSQESGRVVFRREDEKELSGTYDASNDSLSLLLPDVAQPFIFKRAAASVPPHYTYRIPPVTGDGWKTVSASAAGFDENKLSAIVDAIARTQVTSTRTPFIQSLLVARHGRLVLDEYFNGFSRDTPHDVRSAGKSVATLLIGRTIADGAPITPETRIETLFAQYVPFANDDARKRAITLENLMTMSSGLACDDNDDASPGNEDTMQSQTAQPDWYRYTLDLPMAGAPGSKGSYCSATTNLLGGIVTRYTGEWLAQYFDERFARPMQFQTYGMWLMPPPLETAYMAGGDYFLPRDFLKFGQLFLDGGRWNGRTIVPDAWLRTSVISRSVVEGEGYGYGWHLPVVSFRGKQLRAINAGGNGGQLLFVFPDLDVAIMITAANYNQYPVWKQFQTQLVPSVLDALR